MRIWKKLKIDMISHITPFDIQDNCKEAEETRRLYLTLHGEDFNTIDIRSIQLREMVVYRQYPEIIGDA